MEKSALPESSKVLWKPTTFLRFEKGFDTSMGTARIITDAGPAYIKPMGNRQGPHALACEWIGTSLAKWFGLPTFEYAIMKVEEEDDIPFIRGGKAAPGPAFISKAVKGHAWGGSTEELKLLENVEMVSWLVVFDTWLRNCDRYPADISKRRPNKDNVFLSEETSSKHTLRLIVMDHSHCVTCGRDLDAQIAYIDRIKDERIYGLFPEFVSFLQDGEIEKAVTKLGGIDGALVASVLEEIPKEWEVRKEAKEALTEFLLRRARFVADNFVKALAKHRAEQKTRKR